jgi:hypothetical protein
MNRDDVERPLPSALSNPAEAEKVEPAPPAERSLVPARVPPPPALKPPAPTRRRRRWRALALLGLAILVVGGAGAYWW